MRDFMVGVCVAVVAFHVISLFTLVYKTAKRDGVTSWYGFVLGGAFYMTFIMIGQGLFAGAFHPNFEAIHDYQVSGNATGIYGKTESDRSKALEGLSYASAGLFTVLFLILLFYQDTICGVTVPRVVASAPVASSTRSQSRGAFRVTQLSENAAAPSHSVVEMGQSSGGGSSLRFGADRFAAS
jgi:hypothetical protein